MERISAVTHLVSSLEHLANRREHRTGGVNNWEISRESSRLTGPGARIVDVAARPGVTRAIHAGRVVAAAALIAPGRRPRTRTVADAALAGSSLLMHARHHYGTDGSDQVSFLVQSAATLARVAGKRPAVVDASLWMIALQSTMSYAVSGWAKLAGETWRQGRALEGVSRTRTYGDEAVFKLARRFPRSAKVVGSGVLALECSFPLAYLAGGRLARPYALAATTFHASIARIMGLGRFVPSFVSMHPAVLYTARPAADIEGPPRDDTVPRLAAVAAVGLAGSALVARRTNRRTVLTGRGDERTLTTADGNRLAYRTMGPEGPDTPVYLLESGLLSTPEHWEWIAARLATEATVITYQRAGYGASTARRGTALVLDDLVQHQLELLDEVATDRSVVLVGHSLGGYLSLLGAPRTGRDVRGVVLVDSSHPHELDRSERQKHGAESLTRFIPVMANSLELGLGGLLEVPEWLGSIPERARRTALAQYRDSRMWRAARREWAATMRAFDDLPDLPDLKVPVLSISAQDTVAQDPVQGRLHDELVACGPGGRSVVLDGADHDTMLTARDTARRVADLIVGFARDVLAPALTERTAR